MLRPALWLTTLLLVAATFSIPAGSADCHVERSSCGSAPGRQGVGGNGQGQGGDAGSGSQCGSSNPHYNPTQALHAFVAAADAAVTLESDAIGASASVTVDTSGCATGDGDDETGQGGAQFPEISQGACDPVAPWNGHHNGGVGATATVRSNTLSLSMDYFFGTDGQIAGVDVAASPCTGNNVVSDSYDTDPFDCGQGVVGQFPGKSADLQPNPNPHDGSTTDPDPWAPVYGAVAQGGVRPDPNGVSCFGVSDGSAWVFFIYGPEVSGLITNPPLVDLAGCPLLGDGSPGGGLGGAGFLTDGECGLHGGLGVPTIGTSTPLTGTVTAP